MVVCCFHACNTNILVLHSHILTLTEKCVVCLASWTSCVSYMWEVQTLFLPIATLVGKPGKSREVVLA